MHVIGYDITCLYTNTSSYHVSSLPRVDLGNYPSFLDIVPLILQLDFPIFATIVHPQKWLSLFILRLFQLFYRNCSIIFVDSVKIMYASTVICF